VSDHSLAEQMEVGFMVKEGHEELVPRVSHQRRRGAWLRVHELPAHV